MNTRAAGQHRTGRPADHPLAYIRRSRGWSYQELARIVAENARALGVPMAARREKVWRWEHWGVVPEPDSQRALARALGVPLRDLDARPWPRWLPAHGGAPCGLPWTPQGSLAALRALLEGGTEDLRGYPIVAGQALRDAAAEWEAAEAAGGEPPEGTGNGTVDKRTALWLAKGALGLRRLEGRLGGAAVLHRIEGDLRMLADLISCGSYRPGVGARLYGTAAELAELGGRACADTGRHGAAQRHWLTALRLAHTARDRPLAAVVLGGLSLQAVHTKRPQDALDMAEAAERAARKGATPRLRALLAAHRARALAALGDGARCRKALDEAAESLAAAEDHRDPPWLQWFGPAALAAHRGLALLDLGLPDEARIVLDRALAALDRDHLRDRAVYTVAAAMAHTLAGDLARGRALAEKAGRLCAHYRSPRLAAGLDRVRGLLAERMAEGAAGHDDGVPPAPPGSIVV